MYCIYRITNCVNGKTYIGKHKYKDTPYDKYMGSGLILHHAYRKYSIENFIKGIIVDSIVEKAIADSIEKDYIAFEREHNINGCYNIAEGGQGGNLREYMTDEQKAEWRRKLSESHKGNPSGKKGKHLSEEQRKHLSKSLKGRHLSEEHRRKISEGEKGRKHSEEWCKHISEGQKGKKLSDEHRKHLSEAHKGQEGYWKGKKRGPHSEEWKKKVSETLKGHEVYWKGKHWKLVDGKRVYY